MRKLITTAIAALAAVTALIALPSAARAQESATPEAPKNLTIGIGNYFITDGKLDQSIGSSVSLNVDYKYATNGRTDLVSTSYYFFKSNSQKPDIAVQGTEVRYRFGGGGSNYVGLGVGSSTNGVLGRTVVTASVGYTVESLSVSAFALTNAYTRDSVVGFRVGLLNR